MTPQDILDAVVTEAGITFTDLRRRNRARKFLRPRQVAGYLLRVHFPDLSYVKIAKMLGYADQNVVWSACDRMPDLIRCDVNVRIFYDRVRSRLEAQP